MVTDQIQELVKERKQLREISRFIKSKVSELKKERETNSKKFENGEYEIQHKYWNRFNQIQGSISTLKELNNFVNWQSAKINYEIYLIHNPQSDLVNVEVERL